MLDGLSQGNAWCRYLDFKQEENMLDEQEKEWIRKTAKEEGVPAQTVYDAIRITQDNVGDGYILEYIWERGASQLVEWYKRGVEDGKRLTNSST